MRHSSLSGGRYAGTGIDEDRYDEESSADFGEVMPTGGWNSNPRFGTTMESRTFVIIDGTQYLKSKMTYCFTEVKMDPKKKRTGFEETGKWVLVEDAQYDPPILVLESS